MMDESAKILKRSPEKRKAGQEWTGEKGLNGETEGVFVHSACWPPGWLAAWRN